MAPENRSRMRRALPVSRTVLDSLRAVVTAGMGLRVLRRSLAWRECRGRARQRDRYPDGLKPGHGPSQAFSMPPLRPVAPTLAPGRAQATGLGSVQDWWEGFDLPGSRDQHMPQALLTMQEVKDHLPRSQHASDLR